MPGYNEKRSAGSLRIETVEGRRPRLRRARQAMGVQSSRTSQSWLRWYGHSLRSEWFFGFSVTENRRKGCSGRGLALFFGCSRCRDTRPACVPEQAEGPWMSEGYDVSQKLSRPADLQRSCCAVSFSMRAIGPPQQGQSQRLGPAELVGEGSTGGPVVSSA